MSHEDPSAPVATETGKRSSRQGAGGAPLGSTISIVLAVVAVIVGFLILNNITNDGGSVSIDAGIPTESTPDNTTDTAATTPTTTTEPPLVFEGASVVVANASGIGGSAGRMTTELATAGFTMVEPAINSTLADTAASVVQYDPGVAAAQQVADSVARLMGGLRVEPVNTPPDVVDGTIGDAGVLVLLGTEEADRTIAQLSAPIAEVAPSGDTTDTTPDTTTG